MIDMAKMIRGNREYIVLIAVNKVDFPRLVEVTEENGIEIKVVMGEDR